MDADRFTVYVKGEDICKVIAENVETRFDTLSSELDRPLPKRKHEKVIGLKKDKLAEQIMKEFVGLRAKTYSYLKDNSDEDKKATDTNMCVIKTKLEFQDYKICLEASEIENKMNQSKKRSKRIYKKQ